jgi:F-type H+-transporting ATPase subunit epsilon
MASTFKLDIITPEKKFFSAEVEALIINSVDGEMCVLKGHMPSVTVLRIGELRVKQDGAWNKFVASEGFVEVRPDETLVFVQTAERPEEVDINRAKAAKERAEERLRQKTSMQEYRRSQIDLAKAMARLRVVNEKNTNLE